MSLDSGTLFPNALEMADLYTLQTINQMPMDEKERYGVLGYPVAHSLSPSFQQAGFDALKINARYVRIEVKPDELPAMVAKLKEMKFKGWNCTLPHKIEMAAMVDECDYTVKTLQSVNTVWNVDGKLFGYSTDGQGWVRSIKEEFSKDVKDLRILILGIGGAGRAIATEAALLKSKKIVLVNRTLEKAQALAEHLKSDYPDIKVIPWDEKQIAAEMANIDLIVNCTSAGLKKDAPPILPEEILKSHLMVYDTIYNPAKTKLLEAAEQVGARTANGLSMLLYQGVASFQIWGGQSCNPPVKVMKEALWAAAAKL